MRAGLWETYDGMARESPAARSTDTTVENNAPIPVVTPTAIEQRQKSHPGTQHSNMGGWQSGWDMDRWGGAPAIKLLAVGRNLANRFTTDRQGRPGSGPHPGYFAVTWVANMWANINRSGHAKDFHSHPGAYWSGVYYVDDGGIEADASLGGELEFMDLRGPQPAMAAPHLAFAMPCGLSAGATRGCRPRPGGWCCSRPG
jgi:hypothetical protein